MLPADACVHLLDRLDREIRQTALSVKSIMMQACVCLDMYSMHCVMYKHSLLSAEKNDTFF